MMASTRIKQIVNKLLLLDFDGDGESLEARYKLHFVETSLVLTIGIALVMGFVRWQQSPFLGTIDFGFASLNSLVLYYLRHHKHRLEFIASLIVLLSFVLFFAVYLLAPHNPTRLALFFIFLTAVFFLKGQTTAFFWLLMCIASLLAVHFSQKVATGYSPVDMLTFNLYLVALFFILNVYENLKEARGRSLALLNRRLEELVQQRTKKLNATNRFLNKAQEISHLGSWEWKMGTETVFWSDELCRILGYEPGAVTPSQHLFWAAIHPDDLAMVKATFQESVKGRKPYRIEYRITRPNHEMRWIQAEGVALGDQEKEPDQRIGTMYDITDKKQLESQLVQAGKLAAIGELAAGVAHELNQPLMVIRSRNQLMQRRLQKEALPPEQIVETMDAVDRNTKRMMNIINHLRIFSRQSTPTHEVVMINKVIENCFLLIGEQLRIRDIQIKKEFDPALPGIKADANLLEQVFLNLLSNARDAVVEKRQKQDDTKGYQAEIKIQTAMSPDKPHVVIVISDNGCGIPPGKEEIIFDPFFTSKEVGKGTGLGLSISYGIIKNHNGSILVHKSGPDGTSFKVELPLSEDMQGGMHR